MVAEIIEPNLEITQVANIGTTGMAGQSWTLFQEGAMAAMQGLYDSISS